MLQWGKKKVSSVACLKNKEINPEAVVPITYVLWAMLFCGEKMQQNVL